MSLSDFMKKLVNSGEIVFKKGHLEMHGIRAVFLPSFTVSKIIQKNYERFGEEAFDVIFEAGREHGNMAIETVGKKHNFSKRDYVETMLGSANTMGLGKWSIYSFNMDQKEWVVSIEDSPITNDLREFEVNTERQADELSRGIIHGVAEKVFDGEVQTEFLKSEYKGDPKTLIKASSKSN